MQVSNANNIKIYNLSQGKTLPDWLSDRKRRSLQRNDVDVRRRIQLIQDFDMPTLSDNIVVTNDQQYVIATGVYKPRVKCYDLQQLSLKFERCLDSEVVKFLTLADDYSKLVFLEADRYLEFHTQAGRWYRTRIPAFGRDMSYSEETCDLYVVGSTPNVYRLNLECGRFREAWETSSSELTCCNINVHHGLFACGTTTGTVECFDVRSDGGPVATLDCALAAAGDPAAGLPSVSCVRFHDPLHMGVGLSNGVVMMYDVRSAKPYLTKDHNYDLPIRDIILTRGSVGDEPIIMSLDQKIIKLWSGSSGKTITSVEPGTDLNSIAPLRDSGLFFVANESPKILTYYVPSLGAAPKWCSFLDNLTEELEEERDEGGPNVYDDFTFITSSELDEMGLGRLRGTTVLKAYMHGYFINTRLYRRVKALVEPFKYEDYKKKVVKGKVEEERVKGRVGAAMSHLPKVNRDLAIKLREQGEGEEVRGRRKKGGDVSLLKDERFSALFSNPDFHLDEGSEEYLLMQPLVARLERGRQKKKVEEKEEIRHFDEVKTGDSSDTDSASDDDHQTVSRELREQHRKIKRSKHFHGDDETDAAAVVTPKFFEVREDVTDVMALKHRPSPHDDLALGERVESGDIGVMKKKKGEREVGVKQEKFNMKGRSFERRREEKRKHVEERKRLARPVRTRGIWKNNLK